MTLETTIYYCNVFPAKPVHALALLACIDAAQAHLVEWATETCDDVFQRHIVAETAYNLKQLVSNNVAVLHFGGVWSVSPALKMPIQEKRCVSRLFTIDVDVTDYDCVPVGTQAQRDEAFCIVRLALKVVSNLLETQFGCKHILAVYSGGKGGHLHVADQRAVAWNDDTRAAMAANLSCSSRGGMKALVQHPNFKEDAKEVTSFFHKVVAKHRARGGFGVLDSAEKASEFVEDICASQNGYNCQALREQTKDLRGQRLVVAANTWALAKASGKYGKYAFRAACCRHVWPRIDTAVSASRQHLSKVPYSVHGSSGRIATPIEDLSLPRIPVGDPRPLQEQEAGGSEEVGAGAPFDPATHAFDVNTLVHGSPHEAARFAANVAFFERWLHSATLDRRKPDDMSW